MRIKALGLVLASALFLLTGCELNIGNNKSESLIPNAETYYADGNLTFESDSMYPNNGNELPDSYKSFSIPSFPSGSILYAKLAKYVEEYNIGDVIVYKDKSLATEDYDGTTVKRIVEINDNVYILQSDKTASVMYYYTEELATKDGLTEKERAEANKYLLDNNYISTVSKNMILAKVETVVLPE